MLGSHLKVWQTSLVEIRLYYLFVVLSFIFLCYKYRKNSFDIFLISIFYGGLFSFVGKGAYNIYRIILVYITTNYLIGSEAYNFNNKYKKIVLSFFIFSATFFLASYINNDYFTIVFSQYSKFYITFCLFLIFAKKITQLYRLENIMYDVIIHQVILSFVKYLIMFPTESIVGSIGAQGGALATTFPIVGLVFIWTKFNKSSSYKTLILIIGLLFIGFVSLKRAIWFIAPLLLLLLYFYGSNRKISFKVILIALFSIPIIFYLGVRLNPTLNPERKFFGSFDIDHVYAYAQKYTFGDKYKVGNIAYGRGGATLYIFNKINDLNINQKELFGYGLRHMYTTTYQEFKDLEFGINSKGAANGAFQSIVSNGYIGMFTYLLFVSSIIYSNRDKRLRNILYILFFWEYFFYTGIMFRSNAVALMFVYLILINEKMIASKKY